MNPQAPSGYATAPNRFVSGEDEEDASSEQAYDRLIMPRLVVSLEASDEFLRERVVNLPEMVVVGTHNTDEPFTRRLTDHRALNTDEDTVLNYFDELEFHPERIGRLSSVLVYSFYTSVKTEIYYTACTYGTSYN